MYIDNIQIKNFRNFKDFHISFTKGFQTIIGENNIGKSNLFWAIRLVLDKNISYRSRLLEEKDFNGFPTIKQDSQISISIEFYAENLNNFPNFHAIKTSNNTIRISYIYAHKTRFTENEDIVDEVKIKDFQWRLVGGEIDDYDNLEKLNKISDNDIEGLNLYFISGFRNINSDLFGRSKSLLSQYCDSRKNSKKELNSVKTILSSTTDNLNKLPFIPNISETVKDKNIEIAGKSFTFPISLGFLTDNDNEIWNQLKIFYNPKTGKDIPLNVLGLGQKNLLYLSLFLSRLINEENNDEINILLIEEPEAHLHPQLQKILFSNLSEMPNTQVFMSSHSTHIASDCDFKNLNVLFKGPNNLVKSFSPFIEILDDKKEKRQQLLLKRYLDATRSELFFSSGVILVEGVAEQFIIPAIAKAIYNINLTEYNISVVPIHSRFFDPFLKLFQENKLEIVACAIIDGDKKEHKNDDSTSAVKNAKKFVIKDRVEVFEGIETLEIDLFPDNDTNKNYLKDCFINLEHKTSHKNLLESDGIWATELINRIDGTVKKGRFAQELAMLIDKDFVIPDYIKNALEFIFKNNKINTSDDA